MKKSLFLILAFTLFAFTGCGANGTLFDPWDKLNGGGTASGGEVSVDSAADYAPSAIELSQEQRETGTETAVSIDLSALTAENAPQGTAFEGGTLTVNAGGVYALSGNLTGNIIVKDTDDTVRLVLNGATISTPDTSASAAILFEKTSSLRILTVAAGTQNTLSDSVGDNDADGDGAAVQAKKCSLTVNGTGKLVLKGVGENATGLKVKKELTVIGTQIDIQATNNGVKADEKIFLYDADISVVASSDGIKTDMEAETAEDANAYASSADYGYIYIENTSLDIKAGDDGISANNCLYIANGDTNTVKIVSGGGAPQTITESSSDNADGKALKTGGITFVEGDEETDIAAVYEENYGLIVTGGKFELNSNDDAVSSKGNLMIAGGEFSIQTGDDALHAEYLTKITDGRIEIGKSYEGIEGAAVEIFGGTLSVVSTDDGINAANGDLIGYDYHIYIGGGNITVDAQGDGVDSNGWMTVDGGSLTIYGPTSRDNGALDSEKGILVNGGCLLAVGSSGMAENPATNSEQCYISVNLSATQGAGTKISVYDAGGNELLTATPSKAYQSVIVSLSSFEKGKTYTVEIDDAAYEATLSATGTALGSNQSGGGNQGFMPGGRPNRW